MDGDANDPIMIEINFRDTMTRGMEFSIYVALSGIDQTTISLTKFVLIQIDRRVD